MTQVIPEIVSQHAEETAFLWLLRDSAARAPQNLVADLARLDDRLEAHLDGLRVNGEPAWEACVAALGPELPGELFAAGVLAFEGGQEDRIHGVLAVGAANPVTARAAISALGWLPYERASGPIKSLLEAPDPASKGIGIAASAIHRQDPKKALTEALVSPDPALRARACRAAGELGLGNLHQTVRRGMGPEDEACRFWAAWSAALLVGDRDGLTILRSVAEGGGPFSVRALQLAMRRMDLPTAKAWQKKLAADPKLAHRAVLGAGVIGDPESVPWLIEQMAVPALARVAGEAFATITGAHISYDKLEGEQPEGFEAGPTEDPADENVAMDPDGDLSWPDPDAVRRWWEARRGDFAGGTRYLVGRPMSPEWLGQVLRDGYQRQRAAAALELAIRNPGRPLFEVRAPGFRQQKLLGGAGA